MFEIESLVHANSVLKDIITEEAYTTKHPSDDPEAGDRGEYITQLYIKYFDREPDDAGYAHYMTGGGKDFTIREIESIILNSDEYFRKNADPADIKYPVHYGGDTDTPQQGQAFGPADYIEALKAGGQVNLQRTRLDILDWLRGDTGSRWLNPQHKKGGTPSAPEMGGIGLYDRIEGTGSPNRDINTAWGDYDADPDAGKFFTHADLMATRAINYDDVHIRNVLDRNPEWLREEDQPGAAGGVYESLSSYTTPPPEPGKITVNRPATSEYDVTRTRKTPVKPTEDEFENITDSLKMGSQFVAKTARGVKADLRHQKHHPGTRKKYKQTTDLSRRKRNAPRKYY